MYKEIEISHSSKATYRIDVDIDKGALKTRVIKIPLKLYTAPIPMYESSVNFGDKDFGVKMDSILYKVRGYISMWIKEDDKVAEKKLVKVFDSVPFTR